MAARTRARRDGGNFAREPGNRSVEQKDESSARSYLRGESNDGPVNKGRKPLMGSILPGGGFIGGTGTNSVRDSIHGAFMMR